MKNEVIKEKKVGNIISRIFKVSRILTIVLYLIGNGAIWYMVLSNTKYFSITDKRTFQAMMVVALITILIPGILILILFVKKNNNIIKVIKGVLQLILIIAAPYIYIIGGIASMAIPSSTTNSENYKNVEVKVEKKLDGKEFAMLPGTLPNNIEDIDYSYYYAVIFSDNCLDLEISYIYQNQEDYENEKSRMQMSDSINNQVVEDGFQMFCTIGDDIDDEQNFRFGYDDMSKKVTYRISYDWI